MIEHERSISDRVADQRDDVSGQAHRHSQVSWIGNTSRRRSADNYSNSLFNNKSIRWGENTDYG